MACIWASAPSVVVDDPDAVVSVGIENLAEIRVKVFVAQERDYAAASNSTARAISLRSKR